MLAVDPVARHRRLPALRRAGQARQDLSAVQREAPRPRRHPGGLPIRGRGQDGDPRPEVSAAYSGRATLLADLLPRPLERRPLAIDLLVPVPLARRAARQRGFNQSELIAREIGERIGVPVAAICLERVRETPPQVGRSHGRAPRERRRGLRLSASRGRGHGRRVALVDDVMTTGATLSAGAEALKASGAARVYGTRGRSRGLIRSASRLSETG